MELHRQEKFTEAASLGEKVLSLAKKIFGPLHPNVASAANILAETCRRQNRLEEAERTSMASTSRPKVSSSRVSSIRGTRWKAPALSTPQRVGEKAVCIPE